MMAWFLLLLSGYLAFLLFRRRLSVLERLTLDSVRLLDGLLEPGEDDEKLDALEDRTSKVLVSLLLLLALVVMVALVAVSLPWGWGRLVGDPTTVEAFAQWQGILAFSIGGTVGFLFPKWRAHAGAYSPMEKLLHRIALDHPNLHRWLHDREVKRWSKRGGTRNPKFLLVTGLARSGTTSLLQALEETGAFSSLHYANMPFVLAPRTWRRFFKPKSKALKERSHGDGILVGVESAEALEEPFFMAFSQAQFVGEQSLTTQVVDAELHGRYLDYQGLVREEGKVYLAKNNNALLRYPGLRAQNRDFTTVLMFREPLVHASSLFAMHRRYAAMQQDDPFVRTYMDWLAHHEFGGGHKPFCFDEEAGVVTGDVNTLDYWLDRWLDYYRHALTMEAHRLLFVGHATWSADPDGVLRAILSKAEVNAKRTDLSPHEGRRKVDAGDVDPKRLAAARGVYDQLVERALPLN